MRKLPEEFDEAAYLDLNPDVAAAVRGGAFKSGAEHYSRYGMKEDRRITKGNRSVPPPFPFPADYWPTRRDKLLANLDLSSMLGLEIGALTSPLVKPTEGKVLFVDHADSLTLKNKYASYK
jgi:hypothetical protein